jgi:DNA-binding IclR family transcriptional regulator
VTNLFEIRLRWLSCNHPARISEMAEAFRISPARARQIALQMVRRGFAVRDSSKRFYYICGIEPIRPGVS